MKRFFPDLLLLFSGGGEGEKARKTLLKDKDFLPAEALKEHLRNEGNKLRKEGTNP